MAQTWELTLFVPTPAYTRPTVAVLDLAYVSAILDLSSATVTLDLNARTVELDVVPYTVELEILADYP